MKKIWLGFTMSFQFALVGCATSAWNKYPVKVTPDYSCRYGGPEARTKYYIWKCLDHKRVVIGQSSFVFGATSAFKYESSCDSLTEIERRINLDSNHEKCSSIDNLEWKIEPNR